MINAIWPNDFMFMHDSAPSHRAKVTQVLHSPDLNPLDYLVWYILQELV